MPERDPFEYAILRLIPRVERGECVNVGVVLFCRPRRFLGCMTMLDAERVQALFPELDTSSLSAQLAAIPPVCAADPAAGPIGALPQFERFRWITAPRSTILQPSAVHCGVSDDPAAALERLARQLVAVPGRDIPMIAGASTRR